MKVKFEVWLREAGKSPHSIASYIRSLDMFQSWYLETVGEDTFHPESVSAIDLQDFKQYLITKARTKQGKKLSASTVNNRIEGLRTFFRFLEETGQITHNPTAKLKPQKIQTRDLPPKWLDRNNKNKLLRIIENPADKEKNPWRYARNRAIIYLMLHAGLRVSEVIGLEVDDIDVEKGYLYIRKGKGSKARRIELNKDLSSVIQEWLEQRGDADGIYKIFTSQMGILTVQGVEHIFRTLRKKTQMDDLTPHTLRHTFCHDLIERGFSLSLVADIAGHDDLNTTRRYTLSSEDERRKALDSLSSER